MMQQIGCAFYLVILLQTMGCSGDSRKPKKVVLIFNSLSEKGPFTNQIKYVDDYLISHVFVPGEFERDKYVISTSREYIDIAYQSRESISRHFVFRNGDSVLVQLEENWPVMTVLNRQAGDYESNFERSIQKALYHDKPSALDEYHYYWSTANSEISPISGSVISEELLFLKKKAFREIGKEFVYIDSLVTREVIEPEIADFFKMKKAFMRDELKLLDEEKMNLFSKETIPAMLSRINGGSKDSINYIPTFYDDFITLYYSVFVSKELQGRSDLDSLSQLAYYSTLFGKSLLFKHFDKLLYSSSIEEGKQLLQAFAGDTLLEHWSKYFYSKYNLDQTFDHSWSISNNRIGTVTFENLLLENQGSLLYVDLWASWCLKSLKEKPALEKLCHDYKSKGVNIVHISADQEFEKWEWAQNKYLGFNQKDSYILQNLDVVTISETFGSSLPKYLLFDQHGNLLHGNAPNPGSEEIRVLFKRYLDNTGAKDSSLQ